MGFKKRPCSICRCWFLPDPRVGARQKTCSSPACQAERRRRTQCNWRQKNRSYQADYRLREQAEKLVSGDLEVTPMRGPPAEIAQVPWPFAKDAMGAKATVFMAFFIRLVMRSVKDQRCTESAVITGQISGHSLPVAKDQSDFGSPDCHAPP